MRKLNRTQLAELLPHGGEMCLLETVESWDADSITCKAIGHRDPKHPLRSGQGLSAVCGAEYAAQAMAVHGALTSGVRSGMLAALRDVELFVPRLDDQSGDLTIHARKLIAESNRLLYEFSVRCNESLLVTGRAAVVLDT